MNDPQQAVVVTGAAGGIGNAICGMLQQRGYWVLGTDRVTTAGQAAWDAYAAIDLHDLAASDSAAAQGLQQLRQTLGDRPLRGIVHAAAAQIVGDLEALSVAEFNRILAVNLVAPYSLTRAFAPELRQTGGSVVFISSIHARLSKPGFALYATSKAALSGLTRALALEFAPRVRVNEVSPAATDTAMLRSGFGDRWGPDIEARLGRMHPLGRIAAPREIASAVAFLLSDDAAFITAATLEVGGGIHARLHEV